VGFKRSKGVAQVALGKAHKPRRERNFVRARETTDVPDRVGERLLDHILL